MMVSAIAAMSKNRVIGVDNDLPWHLPADMKYFMRTTRGHHVVMGRKTFESMGVPLKARTNIVITRDLFYTASGILVAHSLHEALEIASVNHENEVFVIGGSEIYRLAIPVLDRIYLTEIDLFVEKGDAFFPDFNLAEWKLVSQEDHQPDDRNRYNYTFKIFERIIE
jgi:dihydrofolate reductase